MPARASPIAIPAAWTSRTKGTLARRLLSWFDRNHRELPWRVNRDPYRIWISEVMLQQTTVRAVVPYFLRFIEAFPTVHDLAAAEESRVLKLWEGLGYYRRARHLAHTAKRIALDYDGRFPDDAAVWAGFPGVGRYILGAVLSQAFERRLPIVEANSQRVLARLFGYDGDPRTGAGRVWVWGAADYLLPKARIGDYNQAIMELGALVCRPRAPDCANCPLAKSCMARRSGNMESIPPAGKAIQTERVRELAVAVRRGDRYLVGQCRADAVRGAGLWEFPHGEWPAGELFEDAARRIIRSLAGISARIGDELGTVKHVVTRFTISTTLAQATEPRGTPRTPSYAATRWANLQELDLMPFSTAQRKLIGLLTKTSPKRLF